MMAHRGRSKTADSNDTKKTKGTPRRLTEKIANMRKREHEQSEAFEQAMKSIFEMQRARIHSGGGSMPSLQAIDSNPPGPTIDMPSIFQDFNEIRQGVTGPPYSSPKERPHSSGPAGRRVAIARANSVETDPYPTVLGMGHTDPGHYWNAGPEWIEGDLSRHKSDSDLQQSLLLQQQASPQHVSPLLGSPQTPRSQRMASPGELGLWTNKRRPNSMTAHALLSPDYTGNPDVPVPSPLGTSSGGAASSLPDLTNIEFSCGLDVPIESDEPASDPQQQQQQHHVQVPPLGQPFHSPPGQGPGPSKLLYSSHQIPNSPPTQQILFSSFPPPYPSNIPGPQSAASFGLRHPSPLAMQQTVGGMQKSTTMHDFRTLSSVPPPPPHGHSFVHPHATNPTPQFRPILPSIPKLPNRLPPYRPPPGTLPTFVPHIHTPPHGMTTPPPMTIIIQPPPNASTVSTVANNSQQTHFQQNGIHQQNSNHHHQQQAQQQQSQQPPSHSPLQAMSPQSNGVAVSNISTPSVQPPLPSTPGAIHSFLPSALPGSPQKPTSAASLPSTPIVTFSPGLAVLPSYFEAKQQQALQLKFASINVGKNEALIRSHSEENLQKAQKDKGDEIQHNPFMGTLANANSVPCVYVEPSNVDYEYPIDTSESPTPGDSPSTSASYASSPPSVRPFWMDHPHEFNEFVFNKWPLENATNGTAVGGGGRGGSPPVHHRSLSDLNAIPPELVDLSPTGRNKSLLLNHQLSLPSIAMTDLTMDEHLDKTHNLNSPAEFYLPPDADFEMEDAVMDSLLKSEVPDLQSFDVHLLAPEANMLASEALMSSSPESFLHNKGEF